MTINLPENLERSILAEVHSGHFASVDDEIAAAWSAFVLGQAWQEEWTNAHQVSTNVKEPVWKRIDDNMKALPDDVVDRIPTDSSAQLDHYLYGTPKRPTE